MNVHPALLVTGALLAVLAAPVFAQTPPPGVTVTVCRTDFWGEVVPTVIHADEAQPGDYITTTGECPQMTPTATVEATAVTVTATPTVEPTWTPEPVRVAEPTMPTGPLPGCTPGGPEPCGGKG